MDRRIHLQVSILIAAIILWGLGGPAASADDPSSSVYPLCRQSALTQTLSPLDEPADDFRVYLPLITKPYIPPLPDCTVYCGLAQEIDSYRPAGYFTYFADEFDCDQLLDYWTVQPQMTVASYSPPANGQVEVSQGTLNIGVEGTAASFPYLYLVDDAATTYDVPHQTATGDWTPRVDWLPDSGNFRLAMRVRFNIEALGEHRIAIYADGHRPEFGGPLFYLGSDNNAEQESWRGLIAGADRGHNVVDLGNYGYTDPFTGWVVMTADFDYDADLFTLAVDGVNYISKPLSNFQGYPQAATRPDILYLGSLALLPEPTTWTDIELDWLRVYAPQNVPPAPFGLLEAELEAGPTPTDTVSPISAQLPAGPFQHTPHWSEHFDQSGSDQIPPEGWQLIQNPDPANSWTDLENSQVSLENNGEAAGVPVWAIFDDMLPVDVLSVAEGGEAPLDYLQNRGGSPFFPADVGAAATYPRLDWRPNAGNIRYAWRGRQTASGYGVEISNGGHFPYFTGAMFYILQDITTPGGGQFIFPGCQEQYFWRLHRLPGYAVPHESWTIVTADYINGTVHLYVDGQKVGWWPESDCSLNWYLKGQNATSPDVLFFGNPATAHDNPGGWSEVFIDWFATFPGLPRTPPL